MFVCRCACDWPTLNQSLNVFEKNMDWPRIFFCFCFVVDFFYWINFFNPSNVYLVLFLFIYNRKYIYDWQSIDALIDLVYDIFFCCFFQCLNILIFLCVCLCVHEFVMLVRLRVWGLGLRFIFIFFGCEINEKKTQIE